jgi:3'(2'), 5'-bisphosphate nucleotidase
MMQASEIRRLAEGLLSVALAAARAQMAHFGTGMEVQRKADQSPVTAADRQSEEIILAGLARVAPGVPVIAEEEVAAGRIPDITGPFFLVDPLDGTKAFVRGDPHFTVNIGLIEDGRPVAGAVVAPPSGEAWYTRGGVALKRMPGVADHPVRVRAWPAGEAIALISHTMKVETADKLAAEYGFHIREPMDSSIKFCRIAEGGADIYPRHGPTMEWDVAAGHAVLEAAGGRMTTLEGQPFTYGKAGDGFRNGWFVARGG